MLFEVNKVKSCIILMDSLIFDQPHTNPNPEDDIPVMRQSMPVHKVPLFFPEFFLHFNE